MVKDYTKDLGLKDGVHHTREDPVKVSKHESKLVQEKLDDSQIRKYFTEHLKLAEVISWVGQPNLSKATQMKTAGSLFSLIWFGFLAVFAWNMVNAGAPIFFFFILLIFVFFGFKAMFFSKKVRRRLPRTYYAITNQRVLFLYKRPSGGEDILKSLSLSESRRYSRVGKSDNASIFFVKGYGKNRRRYPSDHALICIDNPNEATAILDK